MPPQRSKPGEMVSLRFWTKKQGKFLPLTSGIGYCWKSVDIVDSRNVHGKHDKPSCLHLIAKAPICKS